MEIKVLTERLKPPTVETIFYAPLIWIKSMEQKVIMECSWHCCMRFIPTNGRVYFDDSWLLKSSFITKVEHDACPLTRTKDQKRYWLLILYFGTINLFFDCQYPASIMISTCLNCVTKNYYLFSKVINYIT